jgi:predicted transcriptional regulator
MPETSLEQSTIGRPTAEEHTPPREGTLIVESDAHWEAITSPTRFEILEQMRSAAPCSVAELARQMDRPADGLYHHLRKLVDSGLIREVGQRPVGKQVEAIYDLAFDKMIFDVNPVTGRNVEAMRRLNGALLRLCGRVVDAAMSNHEMVSGGQGQNTWSRLDTTWLTPESLAEVNEHLAAIRRLMVEGNQQREGQLITIGTFGGPALRPRRADGVKPDREARGNSRMERAYRVTRRSIEPKAE